MIKNMRSLISVITVFFLITISVSALEAYVDPDTGEILTYEQWQDMGLDSEQHLTDTDSSEEKDSAPDIVKSRVITLPDGTTIIGIDGEDLPASETRVHFDENGKAHLSCTHPH